MEIKDKIQICTVVAGAILADGQITDSEHAFISSLMDNYGLTKDEKSYVLARDVGEDLSALAEGIASVDSKNALMVELALAVAADGELSSSERELLGQVAKAIGVDETELEMLVKNALM